MSVNKVAILLILFTFGIAAQSESNSIKSIETAANRCTVMKVDENKIILQEKRGSAVKPGMSMKKDKVGFPSDTFFKDHGTTLGNPKLDVNFLTAVQEKKNPLVKDLLDKVISPYKFPNDYWGDKFLGFSEFTETKPSNSNFNPSSLKLNPNGNKYFDEGRIQATFKLLQPKREEMIKEIFMGFYFSFIPMNGNMVLEMNLTSSSSSEKEGGVPLLHRKPKLLRP